MKYLPIFILLVGCSKPYEYNELEHLEAERATLLHNLAMTSDNPDASDSIMEELEELDRKLKEIKKENG